MKLVLGYRELGQLLQDLIFKLLQWYEWQGTVIILTTHFFLTNIKWLRVCLTAEMVRGELTVTVRTEDFLSKSSRHRVSLLSATGPLLSFTFGRHECVF